MIDGIHWNTKKKEFFFCHKLILSYLLSLRHRHTGDLLPGCAPSPQFISIPSYLSGLFSGQSYTYCIRFPLHHHRLDSNKQLCPNAGILHWRKCCMWGGLVEEWDTAEMRHTGKERLMEEWNRRGCSFSPPLLSQQQGAYSRGGCDDRLRLMRRDRTSSLSFLLVCDSVEPPSTSASFFASIYLTVWGNDK